MAAVSTDMMSRRIPNGLSLLALASGPVWWASFFLGADLPGLAGEGVVWSLLAPIYGLEGAGAVLPAFAGITYPLRIALDMAMLVVVFIPLYLSFALGLDFFLLTFIIGGIFSVGVIVGRKFSQMAVRMGREHAMLKEWSVLHEFPFAPAIGIAAIFCFAIKLQGLI